MKSPPLAYCETKIRTYPQLCMHNTNWNLFRTVSVEKKHEKTTVEKVTTQNLEAVPNQCFHIAKVLQTLMGVLHPLPTPSTISNVSPVHRYDLDAIGMLEEPRHEFGTAPCSGTRLQNQIHFGEIRDTQQCSPIQRSNGTIFHSLSYRKKTSEVWGCGESWVQKQRWIFVSVLAFNKTHGPNHPKKCFCEWSFESSKKWFYPFPMGVFSRPIKISGFLDMLTWRWDSWNARFCCRSLTQINWSSDERKIHQKRCWGNRKKPASHDQRRSATKCHDQQKTTTSLMPKGRLLDVLWSRGWGTGTKIVDTFLLVWIIGRIIGPP